MFAGLLAAAVAIWSVIYPGAVNITATTDGLPPGTLANTAPGHPTGGAQWVYNLWTHKWYLVASFSSCEIHISPNYTAWPAALQQNVISHELGHCLGVGHSSVPGDLMNPSLLQTVILHPTAAEHATAARNFAQE